ncbi:MAG: CopG family transcriptional regulator [Natronomonas sp.]
MHRYTLVCDDRVERRIEGLAAEYNITEQEVLTQLVETGLQQLESNDTEPSVTSDT